MDVLFGLLGDLTKDVSAGKIAESVIIFLFAWSKVKATVNGHFTEMKAMIGDLNNELKTVGLNVKDVQKALINVETSHAKAISDLKTDVQKINSRLDVVEKKP